MTKLAQNLDQFKKHRGDFMTGFGYIDYRNRRPDYLKAFVDNLVNWDYVAERYEAATK